MTNLPLPATKSAARFGWLRLGAIFLVVGIAGGSALTTILTPSPDVPTTAEYILAEVVDDTVGSSVNLNTTAQWSTIPAGNNLAAGTVTSVDHRSGDVAAPGTRLYSVNLRPVVVAVGETPAFRSLSNGDSGEDVSQLQAFLCTAGYYSGPVDGLLGRSTTAAVKAWQKAIGVEVDGVVRAEDIVFVPDLPTRLTLDLSVAKRGSRLDGGEPIVSAVASAPSFAMKVTEAQAAMIPAGAAVIIRAPDGTEWAAAVSEQVSDESGTFRELLEAGATGGSICGESCGLLPATETTLLPSRVVLQEDVSGLSVPTAAVRSTPTGGLEVVDEYGRTHKVAVLASSRGISVIEGVAAGTSVRVPAPARSE